ncbi:MAG: large conductance mechanosensitive channel protein, partial [Reinekea sp.]
SQLRSAARLILPWISSLSSCSFSLEAWAKLLIHRRSDTLGSVGEATFTYGNFIMAIINFLIIAFVVFMLVRQVNKMKKVEEVAAPAAPAGPTQEELLADILKALKK